ncbi:MAG: hypothetical protein ACOC0X_01420 [Halobacteriota archaeon]
MVVPDGSLRKRLHDGYEDGSIVVLVVSIALAIVIGVVVAPMAFEAGGFYLLILVGVLVPLAYRRGWSRHLGPARAALWSVAAAAVATALYWAGYRVANQFLDRAVDVATVAFLFAVVGGIVVLRRARPRPEEPG